MLHFQHDIRQTLNILDCNGASSICHQGLVGPVLLAIYHAESDPAQLQQLRFNLVQLLAYSANVLYTPDVLPCCKPLLAAITKQLLADYGDNAMIDGI